MADSVSRAGVSALIPAHIYESITMYICTTLFQLCMDCLLQCCVELIAW